MTRLRADCWTRSFRRYLAQEPTLADAKWTSSTRLPYAYANNNPITATDPTGLYRTKYLGTCPNWATALQM